MLTIARAILPVLLSTVVLATIASADTMYHYTGDTFRTVSGMYALTDHLSGEFVVRDGFTPRPTTGGADWMAGLVSYSFTDGHQTLTEANSAATSLFIALDGVSSPTWNVAFAGTGGNLGTYAYYDRVDSAAFLNSTGINQCTVLCIDGSRIGKWSVTNVPEPASFVPAALGLLAVTAVWWARRRRHHRTVGSVGAAGGDTVIVK